MIQENQATPQYNEREYYYPIGPEMSTERWKEFMLETYGYQWFYIN